MKKDMLWHYLQAIFIFFVTVAVPSAYAVYGDHDGPYGVNDGIHGGNRLNPSEYPTVDPKISAWATKVVDFSRSKDINHGDPENVLGQPGGTFDTFSLGDGGWITVSFNQPIANNPGADFAVWENGFISVQPGQQGLLFAELMFVEVSTNGQDFIRFPSVNLIPEPVGGFGTIDPSYIHNVAGKHPNGNDSRDEGTPFDLDDLSGDPMVLDGKVNLNSINFVRVVDVVGDGSTTDSQGQAMYDPYPTPFGTGGADLDAVGVLGPPTDPDPDQPTLVDPVDGAEEIELMPQLKASSPADPDSDGHMSSQWQICATHDWTDPTKFTADIHSTTQLTTLRVPNHMLDDGQTYHWRVRFYNQHGSPSGWSDPFSFTTRVLTTDEKDDSDENGVPDSQQDVVITDLDAMDGDDSTQPGMKTLRTLVGDAHAGLKIPANVLAIERFQSMDPAGFGDVGDTPENMPLGALGFKLKVDVADTAIVDIYLSESFSSNDQWYKYTPQQGWVNFTDQTTIVSMENARTRITITLTDGGPGDADGVANGWIVDPGGLSESSMPPNTPTSTGDTPGSGGGGCFITTMRYIR